MTFTVFTNIITILFCLAVLVQSVRMMRSLKHVRESQFDQTVGALDTATASARRVLAELKVTLSTDGAANARALGEAREVRDELNVMVGIANAMAERLMEAAASGARTDEAAAPQPARRPKTSRPAKRSASTTQKAAARSDTKAAGQAAVKPTRKTKASPTGGAPARKKAASKADSGPATDAKELA